MNFWMYHWPANAPGKKLEVKKKDTYNTWRFIEMQTEVLTGFEYTVSFEADSSALVKISCCGLDGTFLLMCTQRPQVQGSDAIIIAPYPCSLPSQRTILPHPKGCFVSLSIMGQGKKVKFIQQSKPEFTSQVHPKENTTLKGRFFRACPSILCTR